MSVNGSGVIEGRNTLKFSKPRGERTTSGSGLDAAGVDGAVAVS